VKSAGEVQVATRPGEETDIEDEWFRRWTLRGTIFIVAVLAATVGASLYFAAPITLALTSIELEILGFTIGVLVLVAIYGARASASQNRSMREAFQRETRTLVDANRQHWAEQTKVLADATSALRQSLELQGKELKVVTDSLDLDRKLLELEEQRRKRLRPILALALNIPTAPLAIKHMIVNVQNAGMDGHGLVVFFGIQPNQMLQATATRIDSQQTVPFDFGDISRWPASADLMVSCEVLDSMGAKYRSFGRFHYDRNYDGVTSSPTWSPPFLIPPPELVN
jgi:hypothetical protein